MKKLLKKSKRKERAKSIVSNRTSFRSTDDESNGIVPNSPQQRSDKSMGVEGGQRFINQHVDGTTKQSKGSFVDRLRSHKLSRQRSSRDERVLELQDQNHYLAEKVQFLKLQKKRNESDLVRMDSKQRDLQQIHDSYVSQLSDIENMVGDFQQLYEELQTASNSWNTRAEGVYVPEIL